MYSSKVMCTYLQQNKNILDKYENRIQNVLTILIDKRRINNKYVISLYVEILHFILHKLTIINCIFDNRYNLFPPQREGCLSGEIYKIAS